MGAKIKFSLFLLTFFTIISAIAPIGAIADPNPENTAGEIQLEVDGGFDGIARLGAYSPIRVKVSNVNRNINAEIQLEASLDPGRKILFAKPVELTPAGETVFYFEAPVVSAKKDITVRIVENKKKLSEKKYSFKRLLPPETALIGVLSEDPDSLKWLNGYTVPFLEGSISDEKMKLMIAAGQSVQSIPVPDKDGIYNRKEAVVVSFDRDSFPYSSEVLDAFNILIISKYDTGLLNDAQVETIEKWVDSGGVLMLGTGVSWQKVYNGLPDSLKPFSIESVNDYDATEALNAFTGLGSSRVTLKTAQGILGFEYIPVIASQTNYYHKKDPIRFLENDIVAGSEKNPLVIKYSKGSGDILVFTFDPTLEPFVSWQSRTYFFENIFRLTNINVNGYYQYRQDYYLKQNYSYSNLQSLVNEVPSDKNPPFLLMFIGLGLYVIIAGPILYLILKKADRRDWAWVIIPMMSVIFLGGMYIFGFKSRYNSAVINSVSLIKAQTGTNEATLTSAIGVFNNKRGNLKMEYGYNNGIKTPFLQTESRYYYGNETDGLVVGKYTTGDSIIYEQYNVMLWTPLVLNAEKTIQFDGNILKDVYFKDNSLKGSIINTTPYDLLDTVIIAGNNIIPAGNIVAGDTMQLDIPLENNKKIYKRVEEYLDGEFGRTYYTSPQDYPSDYREMMRKRNIFQNFIYNIQGSETKFILLARNEQIIDFGLTVNNKKPDEYSHNLICVESDLAFQPGSMVEIPKGIIRSNMYQSGEIGWLDSESSIRINKPGNMEFRFTLPDKIDYTELSISTESYIPLYVKYNMRDNQGQIEIMENKYEYYLYNAKTRLWDQIDASVTISENVDNYIGYGSEVLMRISVVEMGTPDLSSSRPVNYESELLSMPEISVKGVAK